MRTNSAYINKVSTTRRLAVACLLLFTMAGSLMAQNDRQYVIKRIVGSTVHYLSHADGTLQDATDFSPDCIWYSSNNYNYYFMDGSARMYLKAPLALDGTISVEANPSTQTLNDTYQDFFFYDWDHGLARGVQHFGGECPTEYNSSGSQCWQVVWLSYENSSWKMSSVYGYDPTIQSARYLNETTTVHGEEISVTTGGAGNLADFSMNYGESHDLNGTAYNITCTYTQAYTHYHINGLVDTQHNTNIPEENYYAYNNQFYTSAPESVPFNNVAPSQYSWSISCEGETQYLSFAQNAELLEITGNMPTLYYRVQNNTSSHVLATLTLTVTYSNGEAQVTQTRTATVTVKVPCQNPTVLDDEKVITYVGVTVSWPYMSLKLWVSGPEITGLL